MRLRYSYESNGYTVELGPHFLGRVCRVRDSYEHSNGRTYRSWNWHAYPADGGRATFQNRTRAAAGAYLRRHWDGTQ